MEGKAQFDSDYSDGDGASNLFSSEVSLFLILLDLSWSSLVLCSRILLIVGRSGKHNWGEANGASRTKSMKGLHPPTPLHITVSFVVIGPCVPLPAEVNSSGQYVDKISMNLLAKVEISWAERFIIDDWPGYSSGLSKVAP